jgi:hypothetical protein
VSDKAVALSGPTIGMDPKPLLGCRTKVVWFHHRKISTEKSARHLRIQNAVGNRQCMDRSPFVDTNPTDDR